MVRSQRGPPVGLHLLGRRAALCGHRGGNLGRRRPQRGGARGLDVSLGSKRGAGVVKKGEEKGEFHGDLMGIQRISWWFHGFHR